MPNISRSKTGASITPNERFSWRIYQCLQRCDRILKNATWKDNSAKKQKPLRHPYKLFPMHKLFDQTELEDLDLEEYQCESANKKQAIKKKGPIFLASANWKSVDLKKVREIAVCGDKHYYGTLNEILIRPSSDLEAVKLCCDAYTEPAEVKTVDDINCIMNDLESEETDGIYHLFYKDRYMNHIFQSSINNDTIKENLWAIGEPNNLNGGEVFTAMKLCYENCTDSDIGIMDINFKQPRYVLCQRPVVSKRNSNPKAYVLRAGAKGNYHFCKRLPLGNGTLPNFGKSVKYLTTCGNKAFYVTIKSHLSIKFQVCYGSNLEPAEFESYKEYNCIVTHLIDENLTRTLGISYYDPLRNRNFISCLSNKTMSDLFWASGQPDNSMSEEWTTGLIVTNGLKGVEDLTPMWEARVLCQHRFQ